ncbi:MAG TPA: hypothetical protein VK453_27005 [Micromonosporaceae bacterium]|nr:hypothetical protein [Micromonosporaceae bacterium]
MQVRLRRLAMIATRAGNVKGYQGDNSGGPVRLRQVRVVWSASRSPGAATAQHHDRPVAVTGVALAIAIAIAIAIGVGIGAGIAIAIGSRDRPDVPGAGMRRQ